ncbi:MAG: DUF362 domain-containing protein [Planctomycetota bacterium]|nr:DUF362 domain-containing protein [Planctomycetota bacterium]
MSQVAKVRFTDYRAAIGTALDAIGAAARLPNDRLIIIKPNLTNADGPPVTTPVAAAEAVYEYCRAHCKAEIAIGEGCGSGVTQDTYQANGYTKLAEEHGLRLLDFNREPDILLQRSDALQLKQLYMPRIALDAFIISLPILKDHSFTRTTIAMKNMFGLAPAPRYEGSWNKSKLHSPSTHRSVVDVCRYKAPDLCVVDAVVALTGMHLAGTPRNLGLILASFDPVAVDAVGSELLGHDPRRIEYLKLANGILGAMDDIQIIDG